MRPPFPTTQMDLDPALILFSLKKFLSVLVLPPLSPLLVTAFGLLLLPRRRRAGLVFAWSGLALGLVLTSPLGARLMLKPLETAPPVALEAAREAQAIVILGGGKRRSAPEYGGETVNRLTLERLRYGARLARETGLPVLVTGGRVYGDIPEAELMRDVLETEFNVPVRWMEKSARDTRENAQFSAVHLQAAGVRRVLLVTHAPHMRRAASEFEAQGVDVIPAPTAWLGGIGPSEGLLVSHLPSANSAYAGWMAAHEWLGLLAYRIWR